MARSSVLSSTRRRGSISFVSTTNPAAPSAQPYPRVQRRGVAPPHPFKPAPHLSSVFESESGESFKRLGTYNLHLGFGYRAHPGLPPDFLSSSSRLFRACLS